MGWWQLDPTNCMANATIRHAVFSKVRIHFRVASGALRIIANPEQSMVHATIDATTANSGDATRDRRIRDADFLCINRYPTMTFQSTAVTKRSGNKWDLDGDLTIRDRTSPVTLVTRSPPSRDRARAWACSWSWSWSWHHPEGHDASLDPAQGRSGAPSPQACDQLPSRKATVVAICSLECYSTPL